MSYGIVLENELGETITEYSDVLYEVGTGQTITPPTFPYTPAAQGDKHFFDLWARPQSNPFPLVPWFQQVASSGRMASSGYNGTDFTPIRSWVGNDKFSTNDMAFVQPGTSGIWGMLASPLFPVGGATPEMQFGVCSYPDYQLNYKIASTNLPSGLTGNYGMQIKKADGSVSFDSRAKILPLVGSFYVSEADMKAVLETGATRIYTIPTPAAGAYLSIPYWVAFRFTGGGGVWVPIIRQVDDDRFMVLRGQVPDIQPGRIPAEGFITASSYYHDATVMVAMDI